VPGDYVNLVAFDRAFELWFGLEVNDTAAQLCGHLMHIVLVEIEFLSYLLIRQIEAHQIQAQNPLAQRLLMMSKDRIGQVVEIAITSFAVIALPLALALM